MRIGVISDVHGDIFTLEKAIKAMGHVDCILNLGDYGYDVDKYEKNSKLKVEMIKIKGNCDYEYNYPSEEILCFEDIKVFVTHGHNYDVKVSDSRIFYRGKELNVDAVLFGHSHIPYNKCYENLLIFNPGSIGKPKGGSDHSYGILEINKNKIKAYNCSV